MDNKIILGSLALDLKRAAIGYNRRSLVMADRFLTEALKRKREAEKRNLQPYLRRILDKIETLKTKQTSAKAEEALMYSTLIQNYIFYSKF